MEKKSTGNIFPVTSRLNLPQMLFVYFEVAIDICNQRSYSEFQKEQFTKNMLEAIQSGELKTRNTVNSKLPIPVKDTLTHLLNLKDVNNWLESRGEFFKWSPTEAQPSKLDSIPVKDKNHWRHLVQTEAYEYWLRLLAAGANPTVNSISRRMAIWCVDNNIRGNKNQFPAAGTIRNAVLGAGHWTPPVHSRVMAKKHVAQNA